MSKLCRNMIIAIASIFVGYFFFVIAFAHESIDIDNIPSWGIIVLYILTVIFNLVGIFFVALFVKGSLESLQCMCKIGSETESKKQMITFAKCAEGIIILNCVVLCIVVFILTLMKNIVAAVILASGILIFLIGDILLVLFTYKHIKKNKTK